MTAGRWLLVPALASAPLLGGCAPARTPTPIILQTEWTRAREDLAVLRKDTAEAPYVELVRVAVREPHTGRVLEGRGAVAVDPHRAMRMILLGPGGRTALDVWVTHDQWRFSIPALGLTRRGDPRHPTYDLPIGFFRWWFLEPLDGRLLTITTTHAGERAFVLREGAATVLLREAAPIATAVGRRHFVALRREADDVDRLEWVARSLRPGPGDRALYMQKTTGLEVQVLVEAVSPDPPDAAAFLDPDDKGVAL